MWNRAIGQDANTICVSDFMEQRITDCSAIFIPTTYCSFQNVCKVFCLKSVTGDSISRVQQFVNWI